MNQSKQCSKCKQIKLFTEFSPDKRVASGLQSRCKPCSAEHRRLKHAQNPEHFRKLVAESVKRNYQAKLQRNNSYRAKNPEKVSKWKADDRIRNKPRILADCAKRRYKLNTKITTDIKQIYALRDFYMAMSLGEIFHVDHIVPLAKGGEHKAFNLQILPAIDNLRKGAWQ